MQSSIIAGEGSLVFAFPDPGSRVTWRGREPFFRLFFEPTAKAEYGPGISQADFQAPVITSDGTGVSLVYRGQPVAGAGQIEVKVTWEPTGPELLGRIEIGNGSGMRIDRVQFPCLPSPEVESVDRLLFASAWGDEFPWPAKTIRQYCAMSGLDQLYPGLQLEAIRHGRDEVAYCYPSVLAMQFLTLYNTGRSVYLACYSEDDNTLSLNAQAVGNSLRLSVNHYPFLDGGSWRSPPCGLAVLPGDWHAAADLYGSRMRAVFKPPELPRWMRERFHGWVQVMMHLESEKPLHRYRDLPSIFREARERTGIDILHVCGWNGRGHDTRYPDYDPDPELGTPDELRHAIRDIHAMGGRVILYTNGRLVDPDSAFARQGGSACVCRDADGQPRVEKYFNSVAFNVACPACTEYGEYLAGQIGKLCGEYGADAVQVDQISCNQALFCHDRRHPHATPSSNFLAPTDRLLRKIRARHRDINPDAFTWIEGCNERFGQYYDVSQGHGEGGPGWEVLGPVAELFTYTYPDFLVTGSGNSIDQLCHTFAQGKPFDVGWERLGDADFTALIRRLLAVRAAYPDYFLRGVFRDNVGLQLAGAVRGYRLDHPNGRGVMVNLWLPGGGARQSVRCHLKHPLPGGQCERVYPDTLGLQTEGGWLCLGWEGPLAVVRFEAVP